MTKLRLPLSMWVGAGYRRLVSGLERRAIIGPESREGKRFGQFGVGSAIGWPMGAGFGEEWIWIGKETMVGAHVTLSAGMGPGQEMLSNPVVRIGDRCLIGRGSSIIGHWSIDIGDDVFTGMNVYVTDQNHGYENLEEPIGTQQPSEKAVTIGAGSWIGSGAVILPGAQIGCHVVVGANSVVGGVIPDNSVVVGAPGRVVRRHDGVDWQREHRFSTTAAEESKSVKDDC